MGLPAVYCNWSQPYDEYALMLPIPDKDMYVDGCEHMEDDDMLLLVDSPVQPGPAKLVPLTESEVQPPNVT